MDAELYKSLTAQQLMLYHGGIRRWPICPKEHPCPGEKCLGDCPPLSAFTDPMPPYIRYSGTLSPWTPRQDRTVAQVIQALPSAQEIDLVIATIDKPVLKWRVYFVESVPHQIESTHVTEASAQKRQAQLGPKYVVKAEAQQAPAHPAVDLLKRVRDVVMVG